MKSLKFKELRLLSRLEGKARRVAFHPRLTVIAGKNDTGKSSLIKSIYWSFGAEPAVIHPRWTDDLSLLRAADFEEINGEFNKFFDAVT